MTCSNSALSSMKISQHPRFPENAIFIIGAGHFGARALRLLGCGLKSPLWVVDSDARRLEQLEGAAEHKLTAEGIDFLTGNFDGFHPSNHVIPAIPVHLASEWLRTYGSKDFLVRKEEVPAEIRSLLPFSWDGPDGSLLVSYADFRCPDDCPEPEAYCTVTRKSRETPLHRLLENLRFTPQLRGTRHRVHILKSRQLAPGVGGYRVRDLRELYDRVRRRGKGRWLLGTACRCHGVVTAVEVEPRRNIS